MAEPSGLKVIIVEDEPVFRLIYKGVLENAGYKVLEAEDGVKGLEMIKNEKPDVVLLDLILPRMGGYEVLKKLREDKQLSSIPVIILSVLGGEENVEKAMELGVVHYRVKGDSSPTNILNTIQTLLEEK